MLMTILFYLFALISVINIVHFGFYIVGANYYDIMRFKKAKVQPKRVRGLRPSITVLIPAHNEALSIVRCLDSVRTNTYRKMQIIVIDDASTDNTRQLVRQYIAEHPKRDIRLMWKRKNSGKAEALNHALKNTVTSDLVMTLDADSILGKQSLAKAVNYFDDPQVVGVAANVRVTDSKSILGLLQKFEYMVSYRSKKFFSITNSEFIIGGVASTYRTAVMKQVGFYDHDIMTEDIALSLKIAALGNKANRLVYGFDIVAMTEGVQSVKALLRQRYRWKMGNLQSIIKYRQLFASRSKVYSRMLTWYRIPMAFFGEVLLLLEPFAIGYVVYLCILAMSPLFVVGAYLTITLYLLWNIMPDEHMNLPAKLKMASYAPIMYFIMYLLNFVQLAAAIRCLRHPNTVLRKGNVSSTWVSPTRSGQELAFSKA